MAQVEVDQVWTRQTGQKIKIVSVGAEYAQAQILTTEAGDPLPSTAAFQECSIHPDVLNNGPYTLDP